MESDQIKRVELRPVKESTEDYEKIEKAIIALFQKEIYLPLIRELGAPFRILTNSKDDLKRAIASGRIQFSRGSFSGRLNARLSKELRELGARWDRKTGKFKILQSSLPYNIRAEISASAVRFEEHLSSIDKRIEKIVPAEIAGRLKVSHFFDATLNKVDTELKQTIKKWVIGPELTPERRKRMADEYQLDMDRWINNFLPEHIYQLRQDVQKSLFSGNRYETLISTIRKSYGVSTRKAAFLARQETNLAVAKFKQIRYGESGIKKYRWRCVAGSALHPVRPWHRALDGKVFKFDDPPVSTQPGKSPVGRNNPGQDYNCRCMALPIVEFKKGK